jgi:hypothetical protein
MATRAFTIGRYGTSKKDYLFITFLTVTGLGMLAGCQAEGEPFQSALAGSWYTVASTEAWLTGEGVLQQQHSTTQPAAGHPARELVARIRADGTFDWSHTKLQSYGDTLLLRQAGDQMTHPADPNLSTTVVWSAYDRVSSRAMLEVARTNKNGARASVLFYFGAAMQPDGTIDYWHGTFSPDRLGVTAYDLDRGPALGQAREMAAMIQQGVRELEGAKAEEAPVAEAMPAPASEEAKAASAKKDAAAPPKNEAASMEKKSPLPVADTRGTNYRLFAPQQKEAMPLIVVLQEEGLGEKAAPASQAWADLAGKHGCAVLITELASVAGGRTPNSSEVAEDVLEVQASITAARRTMMVGKVYLLSVSVGGLVGHMIWQWDNAEFAGYLAWNSAFRSWFAQAGKAADLNKPVSLWSDRNGSAGADAAEAWYDAQGFTRVDRRIVELGEGDAGEEAAGVANGKLVMHLLEMAK